jgi:nucleoside-diphosphate-sugar epimerase
MKVLVTGASGFLGSHVAEQLTEKGHEVRALVRKTSKRDFLEKLPRMEFAIGSVEDRDQVFRAVEGVDAVVHAAGLVKARSVSEFHLANVIGTENLILAAKAANAKHPIKRFVHVSSLAAVGPSHDGTPLDESCDARPVTHYGRSKLEAERIVRAAKEDLPVVILRPPAIYGPRDSEVFAFFQAVSRGVLPTIGDASNTLSMIHGADAASACIAALTAEVPSGSTYFVDDGHVYGFRQLLEGIEEALGKKAFVRINLPMPVVYLAALSSEIFGKVTNKAVMLTRDKMNEIRQPHWVCSSAWAQRDLGWKPQIDLKDGTRQTAQWYRDQKWL